MGILGKLMSRSSGTTHVPEGQPTPADLRALFVKPAQAQKATVTKDRYRDLQARFLALKARYDSASQNDENRRHWAGADGLSAAAANNLDVRWRLRTRSRYEYDNNGYCCGIIRGRADDLVGTGPVLMILTEDDEVNEQIENAWASWCRASFFSETLHTMDQSRCRDGEVFGLLTTNPQQNHPVKLCLRAVECDLVTHASRATFTQDFLHDGIEYDAHQNPVSYTILRYHPGDLLIPAMMPGEWDVVSAKFVLHWFRRDRPGQLRGVPEMTASLPVFAYLRRYTLATLSAAEIAACFSAILETEAAPDDETVSPEPFESLEIERGMMTTAPAGAKLHQFDAKQPAAPFAEFKRSELNECGRPVRMPTNLVTADSSQHNFASAKLDHYQYRGGIRVDRSHADLRVMEPTFLAFWEEASLIPGLLPAGLDVNTLPRAWYWPGWPALDKLDAKNDTEQLNNGTTTLSEVLAEWGLDWKAVIRQRGRELAFMAANGVPPPPTKQPSPFGGGQPGANGTNGHAKPADLFGGRLSAFNPDQPRQPGGTSEGGQFAPGDGGGAGAAKGETVTNKKPGEGRLADGKTVQFVPHPNERRDETTVMVDAQKLDAAWQKDTGYHIPPGGGGPSSVPGRREDFENFLAKGLPVQASRVFVDEHGAANFLDGRHRFSVLRDKGIDRVAVTIPKAGKAAVVKLLSRASLDLHALDVGSCNGEGD